MSESLESTYPHWYAWSQFLICLVAAVILLAVFQRGFIDSRDRTARLLRYDRSFLYMSIASLTWAVIGLILIMGQGPAASFTRRILSIVNSTAVIFAAAHLDYSHVAIRKLQRDSFIKEVPRLGLVAGAIGGAGLVLTLLMRPLGLGAVPDFAISVAALFILILGLWESFRTRGFGTLAFVSIGVLIFQVAAQVPEISEGVAETWGSWRWIAVLNSKVLLISLFLALAYTWMHQKHLEAAGSELDVHIRLLAPGEGRQYPVEVSSRLGTHTFNLGPITYLRILELALVRVLDPTGDGYVTTEQMFDTPTNIDNHVRHIRRAAEKAMGPVYKEFEFNLIETSKERRTKRLNVDPDRITIDMEAVIEWHENVEREGGDPWGEPLLADWIRQAHGGTQGDAAGTQDSWDTLHSLYRVRHTSTAKEAMKV